MSDSDLRDIEQSITEKTILKGHCDTLIVLNEELEKVVESLEADNQKLKKAQDPKRQKMIMDLAALARKSNGIKSIEAKMSKLKK